MKNRLKSIIHLLGYEINKFENDEEKDLNLYRLFYSEESLRNKRFYNIGSGNFFHCFWTNVDHKSNWYKNFKNSNYIDFDLESSANLPLESDSAEVIYSSHTIEHISNKAADHLFNEVFRILKKGGIFRITCPNIDLYYRAYLNNDLFFWEELDYYSIPRNYKRLKINKPFNQATVHELFLFDLASHLSPLLVDSPVKKLHEIELADIFKKMEYEQALNYCTAGCSLVYQKENSGYHINWWNPAKAKLLLIQAGFQKTILSQYGQSLLPILRNLKYFDNTHPKKSMYIEAVKL